MKDISLKQDERILHEIRQYGLTQWWRWLLGIAVVCAAFFLMFPLFRHPPWGYALFGLLLFLGVLVLFNTFIVWKRNVLYITTHRLIDVAQRSLFHRVVSEISYNEVEDISVSIRGLWGTLFKFGDVRVQTANGTINIVALKVKKPLFIQQQINELKERYISKYSYEFSGDIAGLITDKLYELELSDLIRVKKVLEKRIQKLSE